MAKRKIPAWQEILNGRFGLELWEDVNAIFETWNTTLGRKFFGWNRAI